MKSAKTLAGKYLKSISQPQVLAEAQLRRSVIEEKKMPYFSKNKARKDKMGCHRHNQFFYDQHNVLICYDATT